MAKNTGVPAYTIFHDTHAVRNLRTACPAPLDELRESTEIVPPKLERYGGRVLEVMQSRKRP